MNAIKSSLNRMKNRRKKFQSVDPKVICLVWRLLRSARDDFSSSAFERWLVKFQIRPDLCLSVSDMEGRCSRTRYGASFLGYGFAFKFYGIEKNLDDTKSGAYNLGRKKL